jgi:transposase
MVYAEEVASGRRSRRWRSVAEKRQIVQLTMEPGASVAKVARSYGVNANQVFKWRRSLEKGELGEPYAALLPVNVSMSTETAIVTTEQRGEQAAAAGAIHIEFPGRATISVEHGADATLLRCILESLRK